MQNVLRDAMSMHHAGNLASAAKLYVQVLTQDEHNADALHLLGVLYHQQGKNEQAVDKIGQAVALRPSVPAYHANLAEAYRALGQFERAAGSCRMALRLAPDFPEAINNLGLALQGLGKQEDALAQFRRAIELRNDFTAAHSNLGIALRDQGNVEEALVHFRRAVELAPDFAPGRTNLGQLLVEQDRAEEALSHCREAVRLQPDLAAARHNLGNALRALDRCREARTAYLEAIRLDPTLSKAYANLGLTIQQEGEPGEALVWFQQALELESENATYWEYLADLNAEMEAAAEAIPCWERVLALEPDRAVGHNGLGWALQDEGRTEEAAEHFRTALRLKPDFAGAQLSLGGLSEEAGDLGAAEAAFREALRLQPTFALPHARLATLLRAKLPAEDQAALESRLADPQLEKGPRARLLFGLAHVLDGRGEHDRAAECLRQANGLALEMSHRRKRDYDPAEHVAFVDKMMATFDADFFRRTAGGGSPTRRSIFVFGMPRSGTTLIEQVLASHSKVHGAGELRLARETFEAVPEAVGLAKGPLECVPHLIPAAVARLAERHETHLRALADDRVERIVDKMPDNYLYVGFLAALFPQAVFIYCRRDLRDVALSCWMTDFRSIRWANDQAMIAHRCRQHRRIMEHWQRIVPTPIHTVDYEETVADLEGVARRLTSACGLDWEPACLEFYRTQRPIRTASVAQVRQPIYAKSVARWKKYEKSLSDLFDAIDREE